jgi:hypothetical protein
MEWINVPAPDIPRDDNKATKIYDGYIISFNADNGYQSKVICTKTQNKKLKKYCLLFINEIQKFEKSAKKYVSSRISRWNMKKTALKIGIFPPKLEPLDIYTQRAFYEQINQTTSIQFIH